MAMSYASYKPLKGRMIKASNQSLLDELAELGFIAKGLKAKTEYLIVDYVDDYPIVIIDNVPTTLIHRGMYTVRKDK